MHQNQLENAVSWIIKIGLWVIPFLPLYVSGTMLFPFITGKNFAFRILIELLFAFWLGLIVAWPHYRPRLTSLVKFVTVFLVVLFFADLFSPNPLRSFFSNYERMEGFMMIGHLYLYFLMLVSMFRTKRDWMVFFHATLAASIIVAFIGLMQRFGYRVSLQGGFRVDSTIGNPSYLAAYLSFHVWLLFILLRTFWEKWWLRIAYGAAIVFELLIIYFTATRGAAVAFVVGAFLLLLGLMVFWKRIFPTMHTLRRLAGVLLVLVVLVPALFWQLRATDFVRSSPVLSRFASISLTDRTTQSRFAIWNMSFQGAMVRPILGWGQENYYLVFQKYFDPVLWSSEPWFDRSHNIVLDWLIHAGILGVVSFFSVLGTAFYLLWRGITQARLDPFVAIVVGVVFVSYLIQNLFVFDNLNTYLLLFAFLAFVHHVSFDHTVHGSEKGIRHGGDHVSASSFRFWAVGGSMVALFFILLYPVHLKPIQESRTLIRALSFHQARAAGSEILGTFQEALSYNTFGDTEVREQLAAMGRTASTDNRFTPEERRAFVELTVEELRKEISGPHKDIKHMLFLAAVLVRARDMNPLYVQEAERLLKDAIEISPTKQILYFELAQFYMQFGRNEEALAALHTAWTLEQNNHQAATNLMTIAILTGRPDVVEEVRSGFDESLLDEAGMKRLGEAYGEVGDFKNSMQYFERLIAIYPNNADYHSAFAVGLSETGEIEKARVHAREAARLNPQQYQERVEQFLEYLNTK